MTLIRASCAVGTWAPAEASDKLLQSRNEPGGEESGVINAAQLAALPHHRTDALGENLRVARICWGWTRGE